MASKPHRPNNASNIKIAGRNESKDMWTKSVGRVSVAAETRCSLGHPVKIKVLYDAVPANKHWSNPKQKFSENFRDTPEKGNATCSLVLENLAPDTRYEYRIYGICTGGAAENRQSEDYNGGSFWTNRAPSPPKLLLPLNNAQFAASSPMMFTWNHIDADPDDKQTAWQLRYRQVATGVAGAWVVKQQTEKNERWDSNANQFRGNSFYEWSVRTKDQQGRWGDWAKPYSFFATGVTMPPIPRAPISNVAVDATKDTLFRWRFKDPNQADAQVRADLRYRVVDADAAPDQVGPAWTTVLGTTDPGLPGSTEQWTLPAGTFAYPGYRYEWQVHTYDTPVAQPSDWSPSGFFHTVGRVGGGALNPPLPDPNYIQGSLGCGTYRVCLYERGGEVYRGQIDPVAALSFSRLRDDISTCDVTTIGFGADCGTMLKRIRSWVHELVVFRDGVRVWEGPITRITYTRDSVSFEAKDCMAYLYRRIMRQGYNDGYMKGHRDPDTGDWVPTETAHGRSVVERAYQITLNALAYQDPNLLPYLTAFQYSSDAHQARIVPDYSQTAWQQIDDLASNAGLDYVTIGRRIMYWDTHRPLGRLPEMRDGDFSDPPVVTEYGMQLATYSAVTRGDGTFGAVQKVTDRQRFLPNGNQNPNFNDWYGPVEMLASSYSETDSPDKMKKQAQRNIASRWPTPVVVRVPDNSTLNPDVNLGFEQLVPGVWIPLRSDATLRTVEQWQKLDSVAVTFTGGQEQVSVVMSPAPNGGTDPDAGSDDDTEEE